VKAVTRALQETIDSYRQAAAGGNESMISAAHGAVDDWLRRHLFDLLQVVAEPPLRDRFT